MTQKFSVGDLVETLDDDIKGRVIASEDDKVTIETSDEFQLTFLPKELVKIATEELNISYQEIASAKAEKQVKKPKKVISFKPKEQQLSVLEIDLHIEKLVDRYKGMSNFDILNLQLDTAKRQLEFAIKKRLRKIVFIHGVGEGVLKSELETLFRRYDNIRFYEADHRVYGLGATEVYIPQQKT
ncbi:hypothetical protein GCM10009117_13510 [Gangjinia marincola]|uniref:Smr domain-containing protein n=1 Tax=Gangjinia marincola TaxID=578463 RepID=A0ABN1MH63_9FLAO